MNILEELYYGNIEECSQKVHYDKKKYDKEFSLYEKINSKLDDEYKDIFENFINMYGDRLDDVAKQRYIDGFKTGLLIGVECSKLDLDDI